MNIKILLIAVVFSGLASCSTAYKSGQTPDDVYYSPVRVIEEKKKKKEEVRTNTRYDSYENRAIVMSTRDRRWRDLDDDYDYNCSYDPYRYGYNHGYYYNPYYYNRPIFLPGNVIVNPKNSTPRMTNLGSYSQSTLVVANGKSGDSKWIRTNRAFNNSNNQNGNSFLRRIIIPSVASSLPSVGGSSGSSRSFNSGNNTSTYSPSSSSSSGSRSSSGGGGGSVSRPARGH